MLEVWTTTLGGLRTPMGGLGVVGDVKVSSQWNRDAGCGPWEASWTVDLNPNSSPAATACGCLVEVFDGSKRVFSGVLSEPERGRPWHMHATGLVREGAHFATRDNRVPASAVDTAITRGWRVIRDGGTLSPDPFAPDPTNEQPMPNVDDLLNAWSSANGLRWGVDADRVLFARTDDTAPAWVYIADDAVMGVADDEYVSLVSGRYVASTAGTPPQPASWTTIDTTTGAYADLGQQAKDRWGARELHLDLTPLGLLAAADAQDIIDGVLFDRCSRLGYTNGFTATSLNLRHFATGAPARLPQVKAGDMVRMVTVMDVAGNLDVTLAVDVVLGGVDYDDNAREAACTPMGLVPRVFGDVVADLVKKAEAVAGVAV